MKGTLIRLEDAVEADDKDIRVQGKRLKKLMEKWPRRLGLSHWKIKLELCPTSSRDDGEIMFRVSFQTASLWQYMDSIITAYVPAIMEMDDNDIEEAFIHELCHILVGEMNNCDRDHGDNAEGSPHEERVVSQVTTGILGAYGFGLELGIKLGRIEEQEKQRKAKVKKRVKPKTAKQPADVRNEQGRGTPKV